MVHHKQDDSLYVFSKSNIYRLDNAAWDGQIFDLPDDETIEHAFEYDRYLILATRTLNKDNRCYLYVWDRDSSLVTVTSKIDLGRGRIWGANKIGNAIKVVISDESANTLSVLTCSVQSIIDTTVVDLFDITDPADDDGSRQAFL